MKKKIISSVVALLMMLCMFPAVSSAGSYTISQSGAYTMSAQGYANGDRITIAAGLTVTLIGDSTVTYTDFAITCESGVTLTLSNVNIDDTANDFVCPLTFTGSGSTLILADGTVSTLHGGVCCAGVAVKGGAELTIMGNGTLNAAGQGRDMENHWYTAAGIGGAGDCDSSYDHHGSGPITIAGGTVNATGGYYGAGIGGAGQGDGHVWITGGTVTATGGYCSAGIGGGFMGNGIVAITGGTINATGSRTAAGVGGGVSGYGTVTIEGGTVNAQAGIGAAGIGGGARGGGCTVTISGGTVNSAGMNQGTGIGGGMNTGGTVEISGGTVKATCPYGAAIGSGYRGTAFTVRITGGTVTAVTSTDSTTYGSAGIGRGNDGAAGTIVISDATVFAGGFNDSYMDIDSGTAGADGSVTISGSAQVFLRRDKITPPTTETHTHSSYDAGTTAVYSVDMPADWTDAFGAYLRVVTLSYDANGGSGAPSSVSQLYGTTASAASGNGVTNGSYAFTGWNTASDGSGDTYASGDSYTFSADETLYAQWDGTDVTVVSGDDSYGSVSGGGEFEPGTNVTVTATEISGYFTGWYKGDTLVSSDAVYTFIAGDDVTLTARFEAYITVTALSDNNESGSVSGGGVYTTGASVTLMATANPGYYFTGWYNSDTLISTSAAYTFSASESLTLTAHFAAYITVTAASENETYGSVTGGGEYEPGTDATVTATANAGYYFSGWYNGATLVSSSASYTFAVSESVTLTAHFMPYIIITTVSGNTEYGSVTGGGEYMPGTDVTVTATVNTGYYFVGWYNGTTLLSSSASYSFVAENDAVITAQFDVVGIPANVSATISAYNKITLQWSPAEGAAGYRVWRSTSVDGTYTAVKTTTATSWTDSGLNICTTYYYKVQAYTSARVYAKYYSMIASATTGLGQITGVNITSCGPTSVKITWNALSGATKYQVWRTDIKNAEDGDYTLITTTSSRQFTNTGLTTDHTYYYKVIAYRIVSGKTAYGGFSDAVAVTPTVAQVTGVKAARTSASRVKIYWSKISGVTKYEIWVSDTQDGTYTLLDETAANNFIDTAEATRYYKIRAYNLIINTKHYGDYSIVVNP